MMLLFFNFYSLLFNVWNGHLLEAGHPVPVFPDTVTWISSPILSLVHLGLTLYLTWANRIPLTLKHWVNSILVRSPKHEKILSKDLERGGFLSSIEATRGNVIPFRGWWCVPKHQVWSDCSLFAPMRVRCCGREQLSCRAWGWSQPRRGGGYRRTSTLELNVWVAAVESPTWPKHFLYCWNQCGVSFWMSLPTNIISFFQKSCFTALNVQVL